MLEYRRTGTGRQPVVLLHGWGADSRVWSPLLGSHSGDLDLVAPDLPGHGQTALDLDGRSLRDYHEIAVDSFCEWAERHEFQRAPLVAWAWGTWVAVDAIAAGRIQPRSTLLISLAPSAQVPLPYGGPISRDWPRYVRSIVRMMLAEVVSPETEQWLAGIMTSTSLAAAAGVHLANWSPPGTGFTLPPDSLVMLGGNDRIQPGDDGANLAEGWGAEVCRVPRAGHTPFIEDRRTFGAIFDDWLSRIGVT